MKMTDQRIYSTHSYLSKIRLVLKPGYKIKDMIEFWDSYHFIELSKTEKYPDFVPKLRLVYYLEEEEFENCLNNIVQR